MTPIGSFAAPALCGVLLGVLFAPPTGTGPSSPPPTGGGGTAPASAAVAAPETITVHRDGKARTVAKGSPEATAIWKSALERLEAAEAPLRLAVSDDLIRSLRTGETSVEFAWDAAVSVKPSRLGGRTLEFRRLIVPLSGELSGDRTTLILGDAEVWRNGPYRASLPTAPLLEIVAPAPKP
jgi:hypothetical protein